MTTLRPRSSLRYSKPPALDLQRLAAQDPRAAEVGHALNDRAQGGVDLDGRPLELSWDEFALSAQGFARMFPHITPELHRLQAAFFGPRTAPAPASDPGPGFISASSATRPVDSSGSENGSVVFDRSGRPVWLFDRATTDFAQSSIRLAAPGQASRQLFQNVPGAFHASPSLAGDHVYFVAADEVWGSARLYRALFRDGQVGEAEPVPGLVGLMGASWPEVQRHPAGGFLAAYRDAQSRPRLAYSPDGAKFTMLPGTVEPSGAALVKLGIFGGGALAMTYQKDDLGVFTSYARISRDGRTWSARLPVTTASTNVHDTSLVPRRDGALDLYYVYTTEREGFVLYRRCLLEDGTLGPEQRITLPGADINKPEVTRGPDGTLHVSFVEVTERDASGAVIGQGLRTLTLDEDAPPPVR